MNSNIALGVVAILLIIGVAFVMGRDDEDTTLSDINDRNPATVITQTNTATTTGTTTADSRFSAAQRKLLIALGIDPDGITITPEMEACAETKLGASRMAEIRNGATTSVTEGMELATCFE